MHLRSTPRIVLLAANDQYLWIDDKTDSHPALQQMLVLTTYDEFSNELLLW